MLNRGTNNAIKWRKIFQIIWVLCCTLNLTLDCALVTGDYKTEKVCSNWFKKGWELELYCAKNTNL